MKCIRNWNHVDCLCAIIVSTEMQKTEIEDCMLK